MSELCWIDQCVELGFAVKTIANKLSRALQTIYHVINFLKKGRLIEEYLDRYQAYKRRYGNRTKALSDADINHIHEKQALGWAPDVIIHHKDSPMKLSVKTLYRRYRDDPRLDVKKLTMQGCRKLNGIWKLEAGGAFV